LAALVAATVGVAQTTPQTPTEPPASTAPQQAPTDPGSNSGNARSSADKQSQINDCVAQVKTQVQRNNPSVSDNQIKQYCEQQVSQQGQPQG